MSRPPARLVALDYTAAAGHAPGVGRYVRELVRALVRLEGTPGEHGDSGPVPGLELRLVELGRAPRPMAGSPLGLEGADVVAPFDHVRIPLPRRAFGALARIPGVARIAVAGRAALFHRVHPDWPPIGAARDSLAVAEFPPPGSAAEGRLARAAARAAGVIVFCGDAAERAVGHLGVAPEHVHRVPVGTEHWERDLVGPDDPAPRPARRSPGDVLVLGAVRSSRRPLDVLRGFEALRRSGTAARLLVVGRAGDAAREFETALRSSPAADAIRWIDRPDEARMPACVAGASVLLHLADDEASPVTPLEAARMGLPVVASRLPAFEEALGDAGRWVDPADPAGIARALAEALDETRSGAATDSLRDLARPFTWRACALAHRAAWQSMLQSAGR